MIINMSANYLIAKYHVAVGERNALEEGTLTSMETAGYWLYWASHDPRGEFTKMLKDNDIILSENSFYAEVEKYLREVGV